MSAKFEQILKLEETVQGWKLTAELGQFAWDRERGREMHAKTSRELFALIGTLTTEEATAYGEYRKQEMGQ